MTTARFFATAILASVATACAGPEDDPTWENVPLETGNGADEALTSPDWDLPDGTGDTGGEPEPVLVPTGKCIQIPEEGKYGYWHQCLGHIELSFDVMGEQFDASFTFGPGASNPGYWSELDSYEMPLVAACCGPFDYVNPTSEEKKPYAINCLADGVQQVCVALPDIIRREATSLGPAAKDIVNNFADDLETETEQRACWDALFLSDPNAWNIISNTSWSPKNNATITLDTIEVNDWTEEGDVTWETCEGFFDNDPAVVPTVPFTVPGTVAMSQGTLAPGSTMTGSGPLTNGTLYPSAGSFTLVQDAITSAVLVTGLRVEAYSDTISGDGESLVIDEASLVLQNVLEPTKVVFGAGVVYVVAAGGARFTATAAFEGSSRIVSFTNVDPIIFRAISTGWEIDPFELSYSEPGYGTWSLDFDGLTFNLPQ